MFYNARSLGTQKSPEWRNFYSSDNKNPHCSLVQVASKL